MVLRMIDGMEDFSSGWVTTGAPTPVVTTGRWGNGIRCNPTGTIKLTYPNMAWQSEYVTVGVALLLTGLYYSASGDTIVSFASDSGASELMLSVNNTGALQIYRGGNGTLLYTTSAMNLIPFGTWCYIEVQARIHNTLGYMIARINGVEVMNVTNIDTQFSNPYCNEIRHGFIATTTTYDDLYLCTGSVDSFLGDCRIDTLYPNGNGATSQWVGSDANSTDNYLLVDEPGTPVTTDYSTSSVAGDRDLYTLTDLPAGISTIHAVQPTATALKTDSSPRQMKFVTRRTTSTAGAAIDLTTAFKGCQEVLTIDPETGLAWTATNVNALQAGVECV